MKSVQPPLPENVPSAANVIGYWGIGLPLGAWLAFVAGWGARGIWTGLAVSLAVVAIFLLLRLRSVSLRGTREARRPLAF